VKAATGDTGVVFCLQIAFFLLRVIYKLRDRWRPM
jgi:hypothetical protein